MTGERILWDGRPSIIVYFLRSLLLFLFGLVFGILAWDQSSKNIDITVLSTYLNLLAMLFLVFLMVAAHKRWGLLEGLIGLVIIVLVAANVLNAPDWPLFFIPALVGSFAFIYEYVLWSHTYFAISDRRIMTQYGVFNLMFADTQIDRVQNVTVVQPLIERIFGFGDVMFATAGEMGGIKSDDPKERLRAGGAIIWEDVPRPFEVRKIAEEIILRARPPVGYAQPFYTAPVVAAPAPAPVSSVEAQERLTKLEELRGKGLITDDEYQQKRKEILGQI